MGLAMSIASALRGKEYSVGTWDGYRLAVLLDRMPTREDILAFEAMVHRASRLDVDAPRVARSERLFDAVCLVGLLVRSESPKVDREAAGERLFQALRAYEEGLSAQGYCALCTCATCKGRALSDAKNEG